MTNRHVVLGQIQNLSREGVDYATTGFYAATATDGRHDGREFVTSLHRCSSADTCPSLEGTSAPPRLV